MLSKLARALVVSLALLSVRTIAHAEPAEAAANFDRGLALYKQGDYDAAAKAFFRAYQEEPHAFSLYNAGLAWELAGLEHTAATAYDLALTKGLEDKAMTDASARLERLSAKLGRIEMTVPDGARIHVEPFVLKDEVSFFFLEPGRHRIRITLEDGTPLSRAVEATAGETTRVRVKRPRTTDDPNPEQDASAGASADESDIDLRTLGWVSVGVAAVAAGTAVVLGLETLSARDTFNESGHTDGDARDRAERLMLFTNIAWATAAIAGIGGAAILLTAKSDDSGTSAGVFVTGHF